MLKLYIIGLSCVIYTIMYYLYTKYLNSKCEFNMGELTRKLLFISASIYGSFEISEKILPLIGINLMNTLQSGGKSSLSAFTNEPTF